MENYSTFNWLLQYWQSYLKNFLQTNKYFLRKQMKISKYFQFLVFDKNRLISQ